MSFVAPHVTPVVPMRRGGVASTSRNGGSNRILGPFLCRWEGCPMVGRPFPTGDAIWRHLETTHFNARSRKDDGLMCRWSGCDEVRPSLFRLKSHMRKHLDWRPFGCQFCDERFKHRGDQKKHLVRKHPDAPNMRASPSDCASDHELHHHHHAQLGNSVHDSPYTSYAPMAPALAYPTLSTESSSAANLPLTTESSTLPLGYYVSGQSSHADTAYPVFASMAAGLPVTSHQLMMPMETACPASLIGSQELAREPTVTACAPAHGAPHDVASLFKTAPSLENVCGWLQGAAYAQPIGQAFDDDDEEDRRSWTSGSFEKTPESTLLSDIADLSPLLLAGGSPALMHQQTTPPTLPADRYYDQSSHTMDIPSSLVSLPPPAGGVFDGFGRLMGTSNDVSNNSHLTTFEQLGLTGLTA